MTVDKGQSRPEMFLRLPLDSLHGSGQTMFIPGFDRDSPWQALHDTIKDLLGPTGRKFSSGMNPIMDLPCASHMRDCFVCLFSRLS